MEGTLFLERWTLHGYCKFINIIIIVVVIIITTAIISGSHEQ